MSLTIGLTGMDPATESSLRSLLAEAIAGPGRQWRLLPEADAGYIVVDMDSMYGPMSWLRLHAAGRRVVGLTSASRTLTPYRLARPFDLVAVVALLEQIAADAAAGAVAPAVESGHASGAAGNDIAPGHPQPVASTSDDASADAPPAPAAMDMTATPSPTPGEAAQGSTQVAAAMDTTASPASRPLTLASWLSPGALSGRVRLARSSGPTLLIDADARVYHGPVTLKPLAQYFEGPLPADALAASDPVQWQREAAAAGAAQPLSRLVWLGALLAGDGVLLPPFEADGRYRLNKWPQTEREFPKHFRIATAMMKGPASVAEIAEASGIPGPDVADFINANLATGYAEEAREPVPVAAEPARTGGLLGRLRKR